MLYSDMFRLSRVIIRLSLTIFKLRKITVDNLDPNYLSSLIDFDIRRILGDARDSDGCATNRKVAGSIPDGVIGIFH